MAITAVQRDIPLTNTEFSHLQVAFLLAYALMYAGGGALVDALGTKRGLLVIMIAWSLATAAPRAKPRAFARCSSPGSCSEGEGAAFRRRPRPCRNGFRRPSVLTAMGMINAGTAVGAVIAHRHSRGVAGWACL